MKSALEIAFKPSVIIRGVQIAGLVGTLLTVINQFNELFNGPYTVLLAGQILLNYLIPYLISIVYSILSFFAWQDSQRIILDQKKSFEQFPERNPNPVFRVSAHNKLIYANPAAQKLLTPIHEVFQNTIPKELSTVLAVAVYATEQKELLPKMAIGVKTYEFSATTVVSDQSINVYVRDVTAENVISRLPDRNPAPVLRMSSNGELIYSNHAALPIVRNLKLRLNQPLPSEMVEAFMNGAEDPNFSFELEAEGHAFAFVSEHVPEFGMYNLYGTDISAIKALTRFPKLNPNPVLRVDDSNHLIYANPAASQLLEPFQLCIGDELPSLFAQTVIDAVHASSNGEKLPHLNAGYKVFELGASRLDGKKWINVYARDVTAEDVIRRLPEKNPAAVLRISTSGELLYGNPASASLLKFWAIDRGDRLPVDIFEKLANAAKNDFQEGIEVDTFEKVISLKPVWVPEFSIFNVYGTDVTALKAFTRFPSLNPNPVFRIQRETGNLLFTNPAAERICNGLGLSFSVPLNADMMQELIVAAAKDTFVEYSIDDRIFELRPVLVEGFDFINVYGTDVTASRQLTIQKNMS